MLKEKKLAVIGSGHISDAIIGGLTAKQTVPPSNITVINRPNPESARSLADRHGVEAGDCVPLGEADIVLLCVTPQAFHAAMDMYRACFKADQILISVLAGVSLEMLEKALPCKATAIRAMPNLALGVGLSATVYCSGHNSSHREEALAEELFHSLGSVQRVRESDMDAATALSGCGPGYIYFLAEIMSQAAVELGLHPETVAGLTAQTFLGASALLHQTGNPPGEMRQRICSPGGATFAGIGAMEQAGFVEAVKSGVLAACRRTSQLGRAAAEADKTLDCTAG